MRRMKMNILMVALSWQAIVSSAWGQETDDTTPTKTTQQPTAGSPGAKTDEETPPTKKQHMASAPSTKTRAASDAIAEAGSPASGPSVLSDGPISTPGAGNAMTLKDAQESALANYPQFKNIDELIYQANLGIYQAWTMLMPNLTAEGNITLNQREVAMDVPLGPDPANTMHLVINDKWAKTFGFAANLTLFNPQSIPLIKMAYDKYEKERLTAQIQRNELLFAVTSAYYQAYAMKEMIRVAEENVAIAEEFLRHATILKSAGQGTQLDINRAESQLVSSQKEVSDAKAAEENALLTLKQLINVEESFALVGPGEVAEVDTPLESLKSDAVETRVEVQEAAMNEKLAARNRQYTLTKFLPVFDLTYSWSWASAEGFSGSNATWMLIFGAKWNLLLGGSRLVELKTRSSEIQMAKNNIMQVTHDIEREVEQRHAEVRQRKERIEIIDRQVTLAEESYSLVTKQFQAGLVSSLDVTTAARELSSKKILRVYQRLLFDLSILTLRKAIGEYSSLSFVPVDTESPLKRKF
jgi:outer membrane protein TolC